jgi:hypothetical protein
VTLLDAAACLAAHGIGVDLEWKKRAFIVVHAQSPRQIECCAELGRDRLMGSLLVPRDRFLTRVRWTHNAPIG